MKRSFIVLILFVLLLPALGMTGCGTETTDIDNTETAHLSDNSSLLSSIQGSVACPDVISDGEGGVIVIYGELLSDDDQEIHIRRIDRNGTSVWDREIGVMRAFWGTDALNLFSDGNGGAVTYGRIGYSDEPGFADETVFRVNAQGEPVFEASLEVNNRIEQLMPDSSGNVFLCYSKNSMRNSYYVQEIDSEGEFLWDDDGIWLMADDIEYQSFRFVSDGSNGVIMSWLEMDSGDDGHISRLCGQRIDGEGNLLWEGQSAIRKGKEMYTTPGSIDGQRVRAIPDGTGGIVLAWTEYSDDGSSIVYCCLDETGSMISKERIHIDRDAIRPFSGVLVVTDRESSKHGFLFWSNTAALFVQKLDFFEQPVSDPGEIVIRKNPDDIGIFMGGTPGISGGTFISWGYVVNNSGQERGLHILKLDADGMPVWGDEGITINTAEGTYPSGGDMISDGEGGVIAVWTTGPLVPSPWSSSYESKMLVSEETFVQRFDSDGNPLWGTDGVLLKE